MRAETGDRRPGARRGGAGRRPAGDGARHHAGGVAAGRPPGAGAGAAGRAAAARRGSAAGRDQRRARCRQVDLHRPARRGPHRGGLEGRRARRRPVVGPVGRLDPRRQDADVAAGGGPGRVHPARRRPPGTLGGVAQATRESMVVVEAAGYDVVLVETVGVGQSEVTVAEMVDSFLFLTLARTGDQLQGIKRGILEIADVIAVNKADGPGAVDARKAARELAGAIRMLRGHIEGGWDVPVLTCAGLTGEGLDEVWAKLVEHQDRMKASGEFEERRRTQQVRWTWQLVRDGAGAPAARAPGRAGRRAGPGEGGAGRRADPGAGRPADPADLPRHPLISRDHGVVTTVSAPAGGRRSMIAGMSPGEAGIHRSSEAHLAGAVAGANVAGMDCALVRTHRHPAGRRLHPGPGAGSRLRSRGPRPSRRGEWRQDAMGRGLRGRRATGRRPDARPCGVALAGRRPGGLPHDRGPALGLRPAGTGCRRQSAAALPRPGRPEQPTRARAAGPLLASRDGRRRAAPAASGARRRRGRRATSSGSDPPIDGLATWMRPSAAAPCTTGAAGRGGRGAGRPPRGHPATTT